MMQQRDTTGADDQQVEAAYGRYTGSRADPPGQQHEAPYEQNVIEGAAGKIYPSPHERTNTLRFILTVLALGLILLFGLLFVVAIGGATGWASFAVACIAVLLVAGIGMSSLK